MRRAVSDWLGGTEVHVPPKLPRHRKRANLGGIRTGQGDSADRDTAAGLSEREPALLARRGAPASAARVARRSSHEAIGRQMAVGALSAVVHFWSTE